MNLTPKMTKESIHQQIDSAFKVKKHIQRLNLITLNLTNRVI